MIQRMTDLADEQQIGSYAWTSNPMAPSFYRRFGFEITAEEVVIGVKIWFMWRPTVTKSRD